MKYFCKYLPVPGEIEEGDKFIDKGPLGLILTARIPEGWSNPHISYYDSYQKVKLFLCSRDIQVGDIVIDHVGRKWENIEKHFLEVTKSHKESYKVIGEISSSAVWIKQGDEFEEEEIKRDILIKDYFDEDDYTEYNHIYPKGNEKYNLGDSELIKEYPVKIKCPTCKNYH